MTQVSNTPLTARSVLASTLLGADPPELPVAYLVHVAGLFGINDNRARVALSRMVASGEVTSQGGGRYRLAGHLLARQARQQASREGRTLPWSGEWTTAVVVAPGSAAEVRAARRRALAAARLAELREGVWMRPDNLGVRVDPVVAPDLVVLSSRPAGAAGDLVARLWDLGAWGRGGAPPGHRPRAPSPRGTRRPGGGVRAVRLGAPALPGRPAAAGRPPPRRLARGRPPPPLPGVGRPLPPGPGPVEPDGLIRWARVPAADPG